MVGSTDRCANILYRTFEGIKLPTVYTDSQDVTQSRNKPAAADRGTTVRLAVSWTSFKVTLEGTHD